MRLPKDLLTQTYTKPRLFLCETDKTKICQLETTDMSGVFRFNSYSELEFTVGRTYEDTISGEEKINAHYNKIEALRLVYLEGFGYFEIQDPEIVSNGIQEEKHVTAYSLEYSLSQKYLENFTINTGDSWSVETSYAIDHGLKDTIPVTLYNQPIPELSLLHCVLDKVYGWKIGHIDSSLRTMSRQFDVSRASIYDFLTQDVCDKFSCYIIFDTIENTINVYAESLITKFIGDGETRTFVLTHPYSELQTVSINGYKTTAYKYNPFSGELTFDEPPPASETGTANIEVVDGSQEQWLTDVYITFDNLAQEVNISYSAEDIKTVLTVKGAEDLDVREVNFGLPYIVDLSYYYSVEWMGQELYDAYTKYLEQCNIGHKEYTDNAKDMLKIQGRIDYETHRMSLKYSRANNVTNETIGTYYVRGGYVDLTTEQTKIAKIMKEEFNQTSIDLTTRPKVDWTDMHAAGWFTEEGSYSTLDTTTFLASDFDLVKEDGQEDYAINFTPILPNGTVINGGEDGLWEHIKTQLKDGKSFKNMSDIFLGIYNSIEDATAAAIRLHDLQEEFYQYGFPVTNYYYTEVNLPSEYKSDTVYYSILGNDINDVKITNLYNALKSYYQNADINPLKELETELAFIESYTISNLINDLSSSKTLPEKDAFIAKFLNKIWSQLGESPLDYYHTKYSYEKETNMKEGWHDCDNKNYWEYYPVTIILSSLEVERQKRHETVVLLQSQYDECQNKNAQIMQNNSMDVFFKKYYKEQGFDDNIASSKAKLLLIRISSFLREDEYTDDNFVQTDSDTIDSLMQTKQELLECGRIELAKLCKPKLEFSMDMANIYALPEFEPIIHHFQLGKLINIEIRPKTKAEKAYVKQARLLEVNINFDDFSDFSCEFGELTNVRTPSSIHADLLANALTAGKSVASNASYWQKSSDLARDTDLKIQQGLLSAVDGLYSANQSILINENGILLRRVNEDGSFSPKQIFLTNNSILYSTDRFETAKVGLGQFTINDTSVYGVLADAVYSGYIESSDIVGGTININDTFMVDMYGNVTMKATSINGYVKDDGVVSSINQSAEEIKINADRISLAGRTINLTSGEINISSNDGDVNISSDDLAITSTNFSVTKEGKITATSGEIAGWTIDSNSISGTNGNYKALISKSAIGLDDNVVFGVYDGSSWTCYMDGVGELHASKATIKGNITATGGSIAGYNIGSGGTYDNAIYKRVDGGSTDYEVGMKATSGNKDLAFYVKESTDNWSSSTNTFYIRNNGELYAKNANITGTINATAGNIGGCSISDGVLNIAAANITSGTIATARIPNLNADKITAGTIHVDRIPSLSADKITVGTLHADRIPNISANKITSGTINASNVSVTNLNASNITSGTLSVNRLSSSVITTSNFSSTSLTTGNITVTGGGKIGSWSVTSSGSLTAVSGDVGVGFSASGLSAGSGGSTSWVNILKAGQNASDKRLKKNILEFDSKFDCIFDDLKPIRFEYSKDYLGSGIHFGYIAQDVIKSFEDNGENIEDYAFVYEVAMEDDSMEKYYQFNQTELMALNTWQIQKLKARVEELESKLAALEA